MADKGEKYSDNASGKFYVDEQCIDCDLCRETAPDFFTRNDDDGYCPNLRKTLLCAWRLLRVVR